MLKVLVLCLLNSSIRTPCTKQGLWSKLRTAFLANSSDIYHARNVSFTCLCMHEDVCKMDASKQIKFRPLCHCWRYDHNRSWPHFQLQEASKDYEETKNMITMHFYPCNMRKDALGYTRLTQLHQISSCPRTQLRYIQDISLREAQRLCTWTERRLRTWQLVLKKDDARKSGGRFRRAVPTSLSPSMTPAIGTRTETNTSLSPGLSPYIMSPSPGLSPYLLGTRTETNTSPSPGLSPSLWTTIEHSGSSGYNETPPSFSSSLDNRSLKGYISGVSSLPQAQQTTAFIDYSLLRGGYAVSTHTAEKVSNSWMGISSSTLPLSDVRLSLFTFEQSDSATGGASFSQDSVVKLMSIYETAISAERSSGFHLSADLTYTQDDNRRLSDAFQKTLLTEVSLQKSATSSFMKASSYRLSSETSVNSDSEIPWNKMYRESEMSSYISLLTSDGSFINDVSSVEPTAFKESPSYWHQSFPAVSPTSRMTLLPGFEGITMTPHSSVSSVQTVSFPQPSELDSSSVLIEHRIRADPSVSPTLSLMEENMQASDRNLWSTLYNKGDHSDLRPTSLKRISAATSYVMSLETSVPPVESVTTVFKQNEFDYGNKPASSDDLDFVNLPVSITSFLAEQNSMQDLVGYIPSTSNNPTHFSDPSSVFAESTSMLIDSMLMFSESSDHALSLQSLAMQTVPLLPMKESDHSSENLPVHYRITVDQSMPPTLSLMEEKMHVSLGNVWSIFNNQGDYSDSSVISQEISAAPGYEMGSSSDSSVEIINAAPGYEMDSSSDFSGIRALSSAFRIASITDEKAEQTSVGYLWSTLYFYGDLPHSSPVASVTAFVVSDVSIEPSAPTTTKRVPVTSMHTAPLLQRYNSGYGDRSFSVYSAVASNALDTSLKNTIEAPSSIQPTPVLEGSKLPIESSDSVKPSNSDSFDSIGSDSVYWGNTRTRDYKILVSPSPQENLYFADGRTAEFNTPDSLTQADDTHRETIELLESTPVSLVSLHTYSVPSTLASHSELRTKYSLNHTESENIQWLTSIIEEPSPSINSTESSLKVFTYSAIVVRSNNGDIGGLLESQQTSLMLETLYYQMGSFPSLTKPNNMPISGIPESPLSSEITDNLSPSTGLHAVSSLFDHWPLRTYSEPIIDVSTHSPVVVSSNRIGLHEPLTTLRENTWLVSSMEYQLSTSFGLDDFSEFSRDSYLHGSQAVATEQYPSEDSQHTSFSGLSSSQYPVYVSLAENMVSYVLAPIMGTRVNLNNSEIVIDELQTEALSPTATTNLAVMTGSIFDLAGNGLYTALESVGSTFPHVSTDVLSSTAIAEGPLIHSQSEAVSVSYYFTYAKVEFKETVLQTEDIFASGSLKEMQIFSLESLMEGAFKTLSVLLENVEGAPFEKSAFLSLPVESAEKFVFTSLEDFHLSQSITVLTTTFKNSAGFDREPDRHTLVAQIPSLSVQQTLPPDYSRDKTLISLSPAEMPYSLGITPSTQMSEDMFSFKRTVPFSNSDIKTLISLSPTEKPYSEGITPSTQMSEDMFSFKGTVPLSNSDIKTLISLSPAEMPYSLGITPSTQMSEDMFSFKGTVPFSNSDIKTLISLSPTEKPYSEGITPSTQMSEDMFSFKGTVPLSNSDIKTLISLSPAEMPYSLGITPSTQMSEDMFSFKGTVPFSNSDIKTLISSSPAEKPYSEGITPLFSISEVLLNSVSNAEAVSVKDATDLLSASFSSFFTTSCAVLNTDSLCAVPIWLSARSSLFSPTGVSTEPHSSTASQLSLSPSSFRISAGFMTGLPEGSSTITSIDFNLYMPRSDLRPTTSFSYPAALLSAVTTPLFRGTVRPSSPPSQSRTSMALPTGLTAVVTPSPQNSLDLPSVTKTVPLFVVESTVGRMAKSASLSLISSPLPLTWFTPPLRLSATKIASLVGKDTFSFTATKTSSMNTELRLTSLSLSVSRSALQTPLRTGVQTSALSLSSADSMVLNVISSYSTLPLLSLDLFQTGLPTPLLPTSKTSGLVTSSAQLSVISSASAMSSKPASSSRVASSPFPVSSAGSQAVELSSWAPTSLAVFPPGPVQPNSTLVPFPPIQQEHLLQITLQVNSTVNIFEESFQNALTSGLLLTFLQASQLNGTRVRRASLLITVEIYSISRLNVDSVLVQFVVLRDGKPMNAADVLETLNRLPDLLGTLNDNLPFPVTQVPSAVVVSPLAQFAGWLAAVVVLAAVCVLLASLLGVFVKKSQGKGREAQDVQKRALTPFRKGRLHASRELASKQGPEDPELGGDRVATPATGPTSPSPVAPSRPPRTPPRGKSTLTSKPSIDADRSSTPTPRLASDANSPSKMRRGPSTPVREAPGLVAATVAPASTPRTPPASPGEQRPVPLNKPKRKMRKVKETIRHHQVTPVESSSEESTGDQDMEEATPARRIPQVNGTYEGVEQTREQRPPALATCTGPPFKSTVTPLPPLQPQRLPGHGIGDQEEEMRPTGSDPNSRSLYRKEKVQPSVRWAPGAIVDSDQQRKTEAERLRNKKRLREKQRQTQRDTSPGHHHGHGGRANQDGLGAKRRSKAVMSRAESDLIAWRRVQAQISSLLEPEPGDFNEHFRTMQGALAFPRSQAHLQGYFHPVPLEYAPQLGRGPPFPSAGHQSASSQLANSFGPWAQPWQKAPIPNTRHNAEFLRSLQNPSHPVFYPPYAPPPHPSFYPPYAPPPHPSFYPQPSGLADSLLDGGGSSSAGQSQSPESPSPPSAQAHGAAAHLPGNPPLSPGSHNYLQLLMSLSAPQAPQPKGKRKAKRSVAMDDGRRPFPPPPDRPVREEGPESM